MSNLEVVELILKLMEKPKGLIESVSDRLSVSINISTLQAIAETKLFLLTQKILA